MLKRESGVRQAAGSYRTSSSLVKQQPRFLSLQWKTCLWAEFQPWCLSLQWKICPWAEHMMMMMMMMMILISAVSSWYDFQCSFTRHPVSQSIDQELSFLLLHSYRGLEYIWRDFNDGSIFKILSEENRKCRNNQIKMIFNQYNMSVRVDFYIYTADVFVLLMQECKEFF